MADIINVDEIMIESDQAVEKWVCSAIRRAEAKYGEGKKIVGFAISELIALILPFIFEVMEGSLNRTNEETVAKTMRRRGPLSTLAVARGIDRFERKHGNIPFRDELQLRECIAEAPSELSDDELKMAVTGLAKLRR